MKYIIDIEKSSSCSECELNKRKVIGTSCFLYDEWSGCPLKEFKPKQLTWNDPIEISRNGKKLLHYICTDTFSEMLLDIHCVTEMGIYLVESEAGNGILNFYSFEDAKKYLQERYNKAFYHLIGENK